MGCGLRRFIMPHSSHYRPLDGAKSQLERKRRFSHQLIVTNLPTSH